LILAIFIISLRWLFRLLIPFRHYAFRHYWHYADTPLIAIIDYLIATCHYAITPYWRWLLRHITPLIITIDIDIFHYFITPLILIYFIIDYW
jgi:hypothetical protein